jgi:phosphatidylserine/phosphatidylglycerophosphate/cardiolipin synthase-like enzyme
MATLATILIAFAGGYLAGTHGSPTRAIAQSPLTSAHTSCYFSPEGKCLEAIIDQLAAAQNSIELEGRSLTATSIADALISAKRRGVHVTLVLDAAQTSEHRDQVRKLVRAGIPISLDARHAVADNRVILIDEQVVITGSFSFAEVSAQENADNLLILRNQPQLQASYENDFRIHVAHSQPYDGN